MKVIKLRDPHPHLNGEAVQTMDVLTRCWLSMRSLTVRLYSRMHRGVTAWKACAAKKRFRDRHILHPCSVGEDRAGIHHGGCLPI